MTVSEKDLYEDLIRFYEFQLGKLPDREEFKEALHVTFTREDLRIFFLLPFLGLVSKEKFERKAAKAQIPSGELQKAIKRLGPEGLIDTYVGPEGRVYGRSPFVALLEFQVRLKEESPMRTVCTKIMDAFIEGAVDVIPTKTPYYRVLPIEMTLTGSSGERRIKVDTVVPDPREVLPIDIISEMIKKESPIAVADCYCRSTKRLLDEDCGHPLETCFYFNELALIKLETGYAREIEYDEAMRILWDCERTGLVHNVSNCEGKIQTLCNCCTCSCAIMRALDRGLTNVGGPSRYQSALIKDKCTYCGDCVSVCPVNVISVHHETIEFETMKCIGCGHCVSVCPEGALYMKLREKTPKIYSNNDILFRRINIEAMLGLAKRRVLGR